MKHSFSNSFFVFTFIIAAFWACQSKDPYAVTTYLSKGEQDTLLANIITYTSGYARGATNATRFEPQFRKEYVSRLGQYKFQGYFVTPDSTHYFFINRPVGSGFYKRGVGGKFKMSKNFMPVQYEELWCTPHFKTDSLVQERGGFLFKAMVKNGNIDKYLPMRLYVEWPDSTLVYDKKINEWRPR
ncbi:MAG: hypothetical protein EAZ50_11045 [Runella slithyformis]|nr:MAG: hypothetical protein EAY79_13235 [Runella slithyformis]TAE98736.1 MAG: hypothetical protein EAZ80_06000 [Runella slithyformis]TAF79562.1 MAG: hypothetical protein EAZ50_11045 [Runella slithyformis]